MHAFRLGRVFGIDIRLDWSWVFIFVLMTWNLSVVFSAVAPAWSAFEAARDRDRCVRPLLRMHPAHELAHSVVATRFGLRVRSITLFLFGGVSNIEHEPPSAKVEFWTAIVGPVTSIVLGVGIPVAGRPDDGRPHRRTPRALGRSMAQLGPIATLLVWLGPINLVIGLFNLVPAFPLDGGRVLRSILWGLSRRPARGDAPGVGHRAGHRLGLHRDRDRDDLRGAACRCSAPGSRRACGSRSSGGSSGSGASQAYQRLAIDDALAGHAVEELMRPDGPVIPPGTPALGARPRLPRPVG